MSSQPTTNTSTATLCLHGIDKRNVNSCWHDVKKEDRNRLIKEQVWIKECKHDTESLWEQADNVRYLFIERSKSLPDWFRDKYLYCFDSREMTSSPVIVLAGCSLPKSNRVGSLRLRDGHCRFDLTVSRPYEVWMTPLEGKDESKIKIELEAVYVILFNLFINWKHTRTARVVQAVPHLAYKLMLLDGQVGIEYIKNVPYDSSSKEVTKHFVKWMQDQLTLTATRTDPLYTFVT
jgi:hypothetical protein